MHGHGALPCAMCAEFREQRERRCALAHIAKALNSESSGQRRPRDSFNHLGSGGPSHSMRRRPMAPQVISALLAFLLLSDAACAHDIYTHLKSRSGKSCCDNSDCRPALYRTTSSGVEMRV